MIIRLDGNYKTKDGRKVRILCVDAKCVYGISVIALVDCSGLIDGKDNDYVFHYTDEGVAYPTADDRSQLVECSPWDDFKVDDPVMAKHTSEQNDSDAIWLTGHFAGVFCSLPYVWEHGRTSWTADNKEQVFDCRVPTEEDIARKINGR